MRKDLIVVDDFYRNPDEVRAAALKMQFEESGNYPGLRTKSLINDGTKEAIQNIIGEPINEWYDSGKFQICTANERSWIHSDFNNEFAGVLFLTPNAPLGSGTSFYRHKDSGSYGSIGCGEEMKTLSGQKMKDPPTFHFSDPHQWELTDKVANIYNRLVIFRGSLWHVSDPYFGDCLTNGRLFQLFFFSGENYV